MASNPVKQSFDEFNRIEDELLKKIKELEEELKEEKRKNNNEWTRLAIALDKLLWLKRKRLKLNYLKLRLAQWNNITG